MIPMGRSAPVTPAVVGISTFLLIYGLHDFLSAHIPFLKHSGLIDIQFALIQLRPLGFVHITITLLVPLLSVIAGIALLLKKKIGWWLAVIISSFAGFVFLLGFIRGGYVGTLLGGYVGPVPTVYLDLLVRALLFFACFVYLLRHSVWSLYLDGAARIKGIALITLVGNIIFALLV